MIDEINQKESNFYIDISIFILALYYLLRSNICLRYIYEYFYLHGINQMIIFMIYPYSLPKFIDHHGSQFYNFQSRLIFFRIENITI